MSVILAMAFKDLRLLIRDRAAAFLTFAWPLVVAIFFGSLGPIGDQPTSRLTVALVQEENSPVVTALVERLKADEGLDFEPLDRPEAHEAVNQGDLPAYVVVGAGESEASQPSIEIGFDPRQPAVGHMLEGRVARHLYALVQAEAKQAGLRPPADVKVTPIHGAHASKPPNPFAVTFTQGIIWAVIACVATFGLSLVNERSQGTLLRLCVAPISRSRVLAGKATACAIAIFGMATLLMATAVLVFGVRPESWGLLLFALTAVSIGFVGIMMVLAVISRSAQSAAGLSWAILMVLAMLGGGMLPIFMMPEWLQQLAKLSPVSWALLALEGAIWRDWTFMEVLTPSLALVALGIACFTIGARSFRYH